MNIFIGNKFYRRKNFPLAVAFIVLFCLFFSSPIYAVIPFGADVSPQGNQSVQVNEAGSHAAIAGNVTELNIFGYTVTQSWQGYYGNVTGSIILGDQSSSVLYNWSLASPEGEIYASTNDSISWTNIQCFNFTSSGTYGDDSAQRGKTSYFGTNLSQLEETFGIGWDDVDGVNETFSLSGIGTHNSFYTNNLHFDEGECMSTQVYSNAGMGENDKFEEVLLYDPDTRSVVFASLLNEDEFGFDGTTHDFEMLVLEDGHDSDTAVTPYYFYLELQ